MSPLRRKTRLTPQEEDNFSVLDDFLDRHYEEYMKEVVDEYKRIKKKNKGDILDITLVIRIIATNLVDTDQDIYDYLASQQFAVKDVNAYNAQLKLFTRVIVSEALPIICKECLEGRM